jgi:FkbM family methyltransferase
MMSALDLNISDGRSIADVIFAPVQDPDITVVDVGARNGMFMLPACYARRADLIGFEPNADEFVRLRNRKTEAITKGMEMPRFRNEIYHDCAVWDREESRTLYITRGVGASTMMGEASRDVTGRMYRGSLVNDQGQSMYDRHFAVQETSTVRCRPLDAVVPDDRAVDFLKIDVEGGEMRVLRGAEGLLSSHRILCVMTEFSFAQYYDEHPLLGDQQVFLADRGFRLLDIQYTARQYSRDRSRIPESNDRRPIYGGDAWLVLDPDRNEIESEHLQRMAAILIIFGFYSFAVSLLRDARLMNAADIDAVETVLARTPLRRRLKHAWTELPFAVHRNFSKAVGRARALGALMGGR